MAEQVTQIPLLPQRHTAGHKGDFGKVLVIGGSRGMIGAPALVANAALRSGAGLVRMAVPESIQLTVASLAPCATSLPLDENEDGLISRLDVSDLLDMVEQNDAVAVGPGLGCSSDLQALGEVLLTECKKPIVVDADGLNNLADAGIKAIQACANKILTPHPGEMRRLWRACFAEEPPSQRITQAEKLAQRCHAVVVLKGAGTVVTNGQRTYLNATGNPGMASGGSGDVLTGCIGALLARQPAAGAFEPFEAAVLAVYVHGRCGDLAAAKLGQTSMIATDLIQYLPAAWREQEQRANDALDA